MNANRSPDEVLSLVAGNLLFISSKRALADVLIDAFVKTDHVEYVATIDYIIRC